MNSSKNVFYLFDHDTNIYFEADKFGELEKVVNKELGNVRKWLDANMLSLNIEKTNFIIFRSHQRPLTGNINIKIGKQMIQQSQYVRFLGILWHVFFKIRHFVPVDMLLCFYNSFVASFLQYGLVLGQRPGRGPRVRHKKFLEPRLF